MAEDARLSCRDLAKSYPPRPSLARLFGVGAKGSKGGGAHRALDQASLEVRDGEIVGLVGENGAGKTTLLKIVLGIVRADAGSVRVDGTELRPGSVEHRRSIGYVSPVERSFYLRLSCRDNLLFFSRLYGGTERESVLRVERALETVRLSDRSLDRVESLSSGMRQRLALARALLHAPRLLLLDEPTRSLDPVARGEIHELIRTGREGRAVLIASHDLSEVARLCDRVVVLSRGRTVADGKPDAIRVEEILLRAQSERPGGDPTVMVPPGGASKDAVPRDGASVEGRRP